MGVYADLCYITNHSQVLNNTENQQSPPDPPREITAPKEPSAGTISQQHHKLRTRTYSRPLCQSIKEMRPRSCCPLHSEHSSVRNKAHVVLFGKSLKHVVRDQLPSFFLLYGHGVSDRQQQQQTKNKSSRSTEPKQENLGNNTLIVKTALKKSFSHEHRCHYHYHTISNQKYLKVANQIREIDPIHLRGLRNKAEPLV